MDGHISQTSTPQRYARCQEHLKTPSGGQVDAHRELLQFDVERIQECVGTLVTNLQDTAQGAQESIR